MRESRVIKRVLLAMFACSLSASSHALSVELYEDYLAQRGDGAIPQFLVLGYLAGVAESLEFIQRKGRNKVMLNNVAVICLPQGNEITADLLTAVASTELKRHREHYEKSYGTDWRSLALSHVFYTGLQRRFPC